MRPRYRTGMSRIFTYYLGLHLILLRFTATMAIIPFTPISSFTFQGVKVQFKVVRGVWNLKITTHIKPTPGC